MKIYIKHELTARERRALEVYCNGGKLLKPSEASEVLKWMLFRALELVQPLGRIKRVAPRRKA